MHHVKGTKGYSERAKNFIDANNKINFRVLHQALLKFIPTEPSRILDIGAGIGRDSAAFADMGHTIIAVEPTAEFRDAGQERYPLSNIQWRDDSLPALSTFGQIESFDFILASAVWHHLNHKEQQQAIKRVARLLKPKGIFALSLRHGPAGVGTHVFPTNGKQTIKAAESCGLTSLLHLKNQPSIIEGKDDVTWTKLVFSKK